ncbi:MAG: HD domain-containing protein, partial [Deltaproteobacteria bacterium]
GEGYSVRTAPDAFEALDMIRSFDFDLVLTDIKMPGMSGLELIREVSKFKEDVIFLIITGYASLDSAREALKYGVYDYITKPFDLSYVKLAVSRALERKRLTDENARLKELTRLFALTESITSTLEKTRLSRLLLHSAVSYTDSDGGILFTFQSGDNGEASPEVGEVFRAGALAELVVDEEAFVGKMVPLVAGLKRPTVIGAHDLTVGEGVSAALVRDALPEWGLKPEVRVLCAPVTRLERLHAVLVLLREGRNFTREHLELVGIIATQGAVAYENTNLVGSLKNAYISMIESLILIVEAKDPYTYGHSRRVSNLAVRIARKMGLPEPDVETLRLAANLHDIGKISVPEEILNKPGKLDEDEWLYVRRHTLIGDEVLRPLKFLDEAREIIKYHHERYDGSGYPEGLKGEEIPLLTRIMTVADAYDAMSSVRAYRKPLAPEEVRDELLKNAGKQFDPKVVRALIEILDEEE